MSHTNWALVLAACGTDVSHDALYLCLEEGGGGQVHIMCQKETVSYTSWAMVLAAYVQICEL